MPDKFADLKRAFENTCQSLEYYRGQMAATSVFDRRYQYFKRQVAGLELRKTKLQLDAIDLGLLREESK